MRSTHMKGYMNGASAEPVLNRMSAANDTSTTISGISHHFFSRHAKERHSLKSRHMTAGFLAEARCRRNGIGVAQDSNLLKKSFAFSLSPTLSRELGQAHFERR